MPAIGHLLKMLNTLLLHILYTPRAVIIIRNLVLYVSFLLSLPELRHLKRALDLVLHPWYALLPVDLVSVRESLVLLGLSQPEISHLL